MKVKSISVENLGNIVKQMVNAALEDSDQITKLHQAIYEEWYFQKMMELGDATSKMENETYPLSDLTRRISDTDNSIDTSGTSNELKYLKQDPDIKIIEHAKSVLRGIPIMCNKSVEANICPEYSERTCEISKDEKCIINNNASSSGIIEVWNNPTQRKEIRKKLESNDHQNKEKLGKQARRKLSFETWKKEKTLMYRKLLNEREEKKQQELQKKSKDIEHKKAAQEAQLIKKNEIQQRRKPSAKQSEVSQQTNTETRQKQIDERRVINDQAFNAWRKQKAETKLNHMKLIMKENAPNRQLKRSVGPSITLTDKSNSQFDSWLNRLDNVLHQKYLRERRHLVRSFYCQPIYYGAVTTCYT